VNRTGPLSCRHCEKDFAQDETLCPVCDAPNPWARRDSIHYWCRECGTRQRFTRLAS